MEAIIKERVYYEKITCIVILIGMILSCTSCLGNKPDTDTEVSASTAESIAQTEDTVSTEAETTAENSLEEKGVGGGTDCMVHPLGFHSTNTDIYFPGIALDANVDKYVDQEGKAYIKNLKENGYEGYAEGCRGGMTWYEWVRCLNITRETFTEAYHYWIIYQEPWFKEEDIDLIYGDDPLACSEYFTMESLSSRGIEVLESDSMWVEFLFRFRLFDQLKDSDNEQVIEACKNLSSRNKLLGPVVNNGYSSIAEMVYYGQLTRDDVEKAYAHALLWCESSVENGIVVYKRTHYEYDIDGLFEKLEYYAGLLGTGEYKYPYQVDALLHNTGDLEFMTDEERKIQEKYPMEKLFEEYEAAENGQSDYPDEYTEAATEE